MTSEDRRHFIGGTDAKRIVEGDWITLYEEKMGLREPEDLTRVFPVQLGIYTEPFHANWIRATLGIELHPIIKRTISPTIPWMAAKSDLWSPTHGTFIDMKHTNERATPRSIAETYLPQIAHYCFVYGMRHAYISAIMGNLEPIMVKIEPGHDYIAELVELEKQFWWHIENRTAPIEPSNPASLHVAKKKMKIDGFRIADMTGNNEWASNAMTIIESREAATRFDEAKEAIKKLVDDDVAEAWGHGITIKRDKKGSLRMSYNKED